MSQDLVRLSVDAGSGIAQLCFNRPDKLNAIDVPTAQAFCAAVRALRDDARVRCVVLRGEGRAFVAGGDVAAFAANFEAAPALIDALLDALNPAIEILRRIDAPVIAAVQGSVAGAGLSLMAACDLVVAAEGTRFLIAYDRLGAPPDCGGTYFLPRRMGARRAAEMFFLSQTLDSAAALEAGLLNRVVPPAQLGDTVAELARQLAAGPTRAYGHYKRLSLHSAQRDLQAQLQAEGEAFKDATRTQDFRSGVRAFLDKQTPHFEGH